MNAEELFVHDGRKGETAESLHTGVVDSFRVLVLAFKLEGEVVGKVAALMVAPEQPEGVGIPDLERPEVEDALQTITVSLVIA